jgi:hypothetical protein
MYVKHGKKNTRLYRIWLQMKNRCFNIRTNRYKDYGGRGITVCDEWSRMTVAMRIHLNRLKERKNK